MNIKIVIFLLSGFIGHVSTLQCYTCSGPNFHCTWPLNFDAGDESNEGDVHTAWYNSHAYCQSDYSYNSITQKNQLILRGVETCTELDIPHHRILCCRKDNCNKQLPKLKIHALSDMTPEERELPSNSQDLPSSIQLILCSIMLCFSLSFTLFQ